MIDITKLPKPLAVLLFSDELIILKDIIERELDDLREDVDYDYDLHGETEYEQTLEFILDRLNNRVSRA